MEQPQLRLTVAADFPAMRQHTTGFTLVELVVVLLVLGVISAYVAPRFDRGGYDALVARQDIKQTLRYAQQLAMSRTNKTVTFNATSASIPSISILIDGVAATGPDGGVYPFTLPQIALAQTTIVVFDARGGVSSSQNLPITISDQSSQLSVCVNGVTGYAYDC